MKGPGSSEPLTREVAMQRLDWLAAAEVTETRSVADDPYILAAALRSTYELTDLPIPEDAGGEDLQPLLEASTVVDNDAGGLTWTLRSNVRRKVLAGLHEREAILHACKEYAAPDDPLQTTLVAQLQGTTTPLEQQTQQELAVTLQVTEWLKGIVPTAFDAAAVRRRLDQELLLEPFRYLVGDHFAGREDELARVSDYLGVLRPSSLRERARRGGRAAFGLVTEPPLVVSGAGGIGKSTLLAKFLLEHVGGGARPVPFAYLDFDRSTVEAGNPATVLIEAARQLAVQAEHGREDWEADRRRWASEIRGEDSSPGVPSNQPTPRVVDRRLHPRIIKEFSDRLEKSFGPQTPLLLVLDTFEEVQYRSRTYVDALWDFLEQLQEGVWQLRTVIAGRAPIPDHDTKNLEIPELDEQAAAGYLRLRGIDDAETARFITTRFGRNPLTLRLASDIVKQDKGSLETLRGVKGRPKVLLMLSAGQEAIQRALYTRILAHIHDQQVRALAYPGLTLRRITSDLIENVLAEPCGIDIASPQDAQALLEKLRQEVSLVRTADDGGVEHRSDLRRLMLPMLNADHADIRNIRDRAVAYYANRSTPADRAEEIYHRLARGDSIEEVDGRWIDGLKDRLAPAVPELPFTAQVYLASRVGVELDPAMLARATVRDRVRVIERRAQELLSTGDTEGALRQLVAGVAEHGPDMSLAVLLATAQYRVGRHEEALGTIDRALDELRPDADSRLSLELEELAARIEEENGRLTAAAERVQEAFELAGWLGEPRPLLSLGARWLTLRRDVDAANIAGVAAKVHEALERVADDDTLKADPDLAWTLAGQLGDTYPDVVMRVGRAVGFPSDLPADRVTDVVAAWADEDPSAQAVIGPRPAEGVLSNLNVQVLLSASGTLDRAARLMAALLRDRAAYPSRRLASCVSVSVQFPDAEVRTIDRISFKDHERWWVVYVSNSGSELVSRVRVRTIRPVNRTYEFEMDDVHPGRGWYILPPDSGMYALGDPPSARVEFTALGRRYRMTEAGLDALAEGQPIPVSFSEAESRQVAEPVRVWIDRPDDQVRREDQLGPDEHWWVLYLATDGDRPVHRIYVRLDRTDGHRRAIRFPPIEPGRRRWWVLRPDMGFDPNEPMPEARVEFDALGLRWRRTPAGLCQAA